MADYDAVATDVLAGAEGAGAVKFVGWLGKGPDAGVSKDSTGFRLFTDDQFLEWLVIPADAILHQISGERDDGSSIVWIKRELRITRCQSGRAYEFGELGHRATTDDPTASRPRPYP